MDGHSIALFVVLLVLLVLLAALITVHVRAKLTAEATSTRPTNNTPMATGGDPTPPADKFPYWKHALPPFSYMMRELRSKPARVQTPEDTPGPVVVRTFPEDFLEADGIANWYTEEARILASFKGKPSPRERFDAMMANPEKWGLTPDQRKQLETGTPMERREVVYASGREANLFNPAFGHWIYRTLGAAGSRVLDPSAGWGDRAVAAVLAGAASYVGYDPNPALEKPHDELLDRLCVVAGAHTPLPFETEIRPKGAPLSLAEVDKSDPPADIVLTSPPFFDLEVYVPPGAPGADAQSIAGAKGREYEEWVDAFLKPYYATAYAQLRPGGWLVAYVENARSHTSDVMIRDDTEEIMYDLGAEPGPSFGLQVQFSPNDARNKARKRKGTRKPREPLTRWALSWMKPPRAEPHSPPVELTKVETEDRRTLFVVRDDRLALGTKGRAFPQIPRGTHTVLYTGSAFGYGPVVAAAVAKANGLDCELMLDPHPPAAGRNAPRSFLPRYDLPPVVTARSLGAKITFYDRWGDLVKEGQRRAKEDGVHWCTLGFLEEAYVSALAEALREACRPLEECAADAAIWVIGGSGTIAFALARALPKRKICVVPLTARTRDKIAAAAARFPAMPNLSIEEPASPPEFWEYDGSGPKKYPVPFVPGYDSRLWDTVTAETAPRGKDGDIVWNVAPGGEWLLRV